MCSQSFSFFVVPPALRREDAVKEFSFLQFLAKWRFPNSAQQKVCWENHCWALKWRGEIHDVSTGRVSHTHTNSFLISASFPAEKQLLQTWSGTGTQSIVLVTFMPHFTWVGIFLSLFFRLLFTCLSDLQSLVAAAEQWRLGNTQNCVHSCSFSPGHCQGFDLPGQLFFFS